LELFTRKEKENTAEIRRELIDRYDAWLK